MRRLMAITALALFLAVPLWAQRGTVHSGGGHAGGGFSGHGGFSGGHVGGFASHAGIGGSRVGGHVSGCMHNFSTARGLRRSPSQRNFSRGSFSRNGFRGNRFHNHGSRVRFFGFNNNCLGFGCRGFGYPWAYGAYYDPSWWWDSGSSYDEDYERDRQIANEMNQQSLDEQRMRQQAEDDPGPERNQANNDRYARSAPAVHDADSAPVPATMLVFRDQHQQEVKNYAIVGQTLWAFAPQRTQKISLSDLDIPATTKVNDDRGLTFRVPAPGEAQ